MTARPGGTLELAVLRALFELGRGTAREVHTRLGEPAVLAYTTIATVLDRLREKGLVTRVRRGRAFEFEPCSGRGEVERARASDLLSQFLGLEPLPAVAALVDAIEDLDPALVDELARVVAERRRARHGS